MFSGYLSHGCGSRPLINFSQFKNSFGQKIATVKPDGVELLFSYDALSRLSQESSSEGTLKASYTYDLQDRISAAKNELTGKETLRRYDEQGNLISETLENGLSRKYIYDTLNRLTEITLPDGSQIRYLRNGCRLLAVDRIVSNEVSYSRRYSSHDLGGLTLTEELPFNLGTIKKSYDACRRLKTFYIP